MICSSSSCIGLRGNKRTFTRIFNKFTKLKLNNLHKKYRRDKNGQIIE